jgi:hypothetical protein
MGTKQPTEAEQFQNHLALVDEARVSELLSNGNLDALLTDTERSQLRSYANGVVNFTLLMAEVGLEVARRNVAKAENPDVEDMSIRMAISRCFQALVIEAEMKRASELDDAVLSASEING